jgi:uncharacterized membrane protein HdeD (DUF308 family)
MHHKSIELSRLAFVFVVRGTFLILLSAATLRWPAQTLLLFMVAAGGVVGSFGIVEVAAASISRALPSTKLFFLAHGVVSIGFGVLTAIIPVASVDLATGLGIGWMVVYALFAVVLAARLRYVPRARTMLTLWGTFNLGCAALLAFFTPPTMIALLYAGALYAGLMGATQLLTAVWIRHGQRVLQDREMHGALAGGH